MIWWALLFFACGMLLILAEFIVPGGVCGFFGALLLIGSGVLGVHAAPDNAFLVISSEVVAALFSVGLGMYVFSRSGVAKSLKLDSAQNAEEGWVNVKSDLSLVGKTGVVYTALRPAGTILVDGCRIDAVSDGSFIGENAEVRVIEVHGNRVLVEAASAHMA